MLLKSNFQVRDKQIFKFSLGLAVWLVGGLNAVGVLKLLSQWPRDEPYCFALPNYRFHAI